MSRLTGKRVPDFRKYDQMSAEELREIIRKDALEDGNPTADEDTIRYILEVLLDREMNDSTIGNGEIEAAWQQFQKYYQPYTDSFDNLYEGVDANEKLSHGMRKPCGEKKIRRAQLFRHLSRVVAALVIVVCCGGFATNALGLNLGEILAHWTDEIFSFYSNGDNAPIEDDEGRLQDAIQAYGIPNACIPSLIPNGYRLNEVQINPADDSSLLSMFVIYYNDADNKEYYIFIKNLKFDVPSVFEKDDTNVEIIEKGGVQYYINSNNESFSTVWQIEQYECAVIGDLSHDEMKNMIES